MKYRQSSKIAFAHNTANIRLVTNDEIQILRTALMHYCGRRGKPQTLLYEKEWMNPIFLLCSDEMFRVYRES